MATAEDRLRQMAARQKLDEDSERRAEEILAKRTAEDAAMATTLAEMPATVLAPCAEKSHDWRPVGRCSHGYGGATSFLAYICAACGGGGHARRSTFSCPRQGETKKSREERIERQVAACPIWGRLSAEGQKNLRA